MKVKRIVADVAVSDPGAAKRLLSRCPWSRHPDGYGVDCHLRLEGTNGCPDQLYDRRKCGHTGSRLSIEVDELDSALARVRTAGIPIEYGPISEPWGVAGFSCAIHSASLSTSWRMSERSGLRVLQGAALVESVGSAPADGGCSTVLSCPGIERNEFHGRAMRDGVRSRRDAE